MAANKQINGASAASYLAKIAMLSALAFVLYLCRFPLPIFPAWLELHFSDLPALIGGFAMGPVAGVAVTVVRVLIKILIQGTGSGFVGDFADVIIGLSLVLPASIIYKYNRSRKGAVIGCLVGAACSLAVALLSNRFLLVPFYMKLYQAEVVVGMLANLFPAVTTDSFYTYYIWCSALPFNLLRLIVEVAVTFIVYKKISRIFDKI